MKKHGKSFGIVKMISLKGRGGSDHLEHEEIHSAKPGLL
jgi:hypothetical protein